MVKPEGRKTENELGDFYLDTKGEEIPYGLQYDIDVSSVTEVGLGL